MVIYKERREKFVKEVYVNEIEDRRRRGRLVVGWKDILRILAGKEG